MDYMDRISLDMPLRSFIKLLLLKQSQEDERNHWKMASLFKGLLSVGCDYYELLNLYLDFPLTESDGDMLAKHAPIPAHIFPISQRKIRLALPHWTPSRYHTASITDVVEEIQMHLLSGQPLIRVYNSNLNPKNDRAYNDRYVLLITAHISLIIDINRRTTIQFQQE